MMRTPLRVALTFFTLGCAASTAFAQPVAQRLLEGAPGASGQARGMSVAAVRRAHVRVNANALSADRIEISLFDDVQVTVRRTGRSQPRLDSTVWHGKIEGPDGGDVTLALVGGALAGSITIGNRLYEIGVGAGGLHEVRELNPALFPSEEVPIPSSDLASASGSATVTTSSSSGGSDSAGQIDVMIVWTPAARIAAGGTTAAIQSLADLAVGNANASYANSGIGTSLRLAYSGEIEFTETPSSISNDLYRLKGTGDGYMDQVHKLRDQYGADVVTLMGAGYANAGACGIGSLMSTVSTSFASHAFNVVDQSCAGAYLSYAHEVGHNQGLHHDPVNAGSTPSYSFAYGYQEPAGMFRTVMSYGGATRVQHFSNPNIYYAGRPTGTSSQNNAEALNRNAATVANFRSSFTTTCSYTVTPTTVTFTETGGTAIVEVSTTAGCSWATSSTATWAVAGPGGSGPGSVIIEVAPNTGSQRTTTVMVAGVAINISEAAAPISCTYAVGPTSVSIGAGGGTVRLSVTTPAICEWTTINGPSWLSLTGGMTGSGHVDVAISANSGDARSTTVTVAGQLVDVAQAAAVVSTTPACTYTLSSASLTVPATGGSFQVQVSAPDGCSWTSRSNTGWLKVSGTGVGSGWVALQLNATSGGSKTATATIAGQTISVTQLAAVKAR